MNRIATAALLTALLTLGLVGCSTGSGADDEREPEQSPNVAACEAFGALTADVQERAATNDNVLEPFADLPAEFDTIALTADGDVKTRMEAIQDAIPEPPHMVIFGENRDVYNDAVDAISRACAADDAEVDATHLTAGVG